MPRPDLPPETFDLGRIRLRHPRLSDAEAMFEYGSDPEVARYADWPICTAIEPILERIRGHRQCWDSGSEFRWVITRDDRAIGGITCSVAGHAGEIGFLVHRRHWGNGYATDAARAIVAWASKVAGIRRVWATCDTENLASARVLEKAGLMREAVLPRAIVRPQLSREPRDAFLYARTKPATA
jgi:RimJ/RimL family protein N-acetyltransferase